MSSLALDSAACSSRALDIAQPDVCAAGALTESKKIADMAEPFGVGYNPHVWGAGIAIAASLHLPRLSRARENCPLGSLGIAPSLDSRGESEGTRNESRKARRGLIHGGR